MLTNRILTLFVLFTLGINYVSAQYKSPDYLKYIEQYKELAIQHHKKYNIPASITLAQGLLESGAGKGRLAREGNNHFGIKCHKWDGRKIYHDDDARNECFRKYSHARDSYDDHALFLVGSDRYARLFKLNSTDYKGWAKGLQTCGYATDRAYANKLIKLIDDYELYKYDNPKFVRPVSKPKGGFPSWYRTHQVYKSNELLYVVANANDTYELIGTEFDFRAKTLRSYNEVPKEYPLSQGDVVYLEKKNKKMPRKGTRYHTVTVGESMHDIAQQHGLRLKNLYKINGKSLDYIPQEDEILRLR
ncbi:MAG: glucosaminidase domain-containing protein [Bacteroidales bacterium]